MGHEHSAPQLPDVTDEAGDTPKWVPVLGVALLVLAGAGLVVCHGGSSDAGDTAGVHE